MHPNSFNVIVILNARYIHWLAGLQATEKLPIKQEATTINHELKLRKLHSLEIALRPPNFSTLYQFRNSKKNHNGERQLCRLQLINWHQMIIFTMKRIQNYNKWQICTISSDKKVGSNHVILYWIPSTNIECHTFSNWAGGINYESHSDTVFVLYSCSNN